MTRYVLVRLVASMVTLFLVVTTTFILIKVAPGGLATLMDPELDPEDAARIAHNLGLDQPAHVQYLRWLGNVARGDLGRSLTYGRPVVSMVLERLPATLQLVGAALLIAITLGIPMGVFSARYQYSLPDQVLSFFSFLGLAIPNFWLGILAVILFSVELGWLPSSDMMTPGIPFSVQDRLRHLVLPALVLATSLTAQLLRYTRSAWLEVLSQDFVLVARAKGLNEFVVQTRHIMKNALIPIVTILGLYLPLLVGGTAVVEALFSWPGMGSLAVDAALRRDSPLILGITVLVSLTVIASNLLIDLLYPILDPRLRGGNYER